MKTTLYYNILIIASFHLLIIYFQKCASYGKNIVSKRLDLRIFTLYVTLHIFINTPRADKHPIVRQ